MRVVDQGKLILKIRACIDIEQVLQANVALQGPSTEKSRNLRLRCTSLRLGFCSLSFLFLSTWTFLGKPKPVDVTSLSSQDLYIYKQCRSTLTWSIPVLQDFDTVILLLFLVSACVSCGAGSFFSFKLRRDLGDTLPTHIRSEQKRICICLVNMLCCLLIVGPLYMSIGDGPRSTLKSYLIRSLWSWFVSLFTCVCLLVPKFIDVQGDPWNGYGTSSEESQND
jgi:hypothetical protein